MTTAAAVYTREHFERLEDERLAVYASRSARAERPHGPVSSSPADARTNYARDRDRIIPVSYTHLTLPTICSV